MSELIHNFGIDWKLLLAQVVNFFVLLWLLKHFAYKPILGMIRKRKEEIEKGLAYTKEAETRLKETDAMREEALKKARREALSIVGEAEGMAKKRKEEITAEANKKAESVLLDAKRTIAEEKAKMGESVYRDTEELLRLGIAKVLGKMPKEDRDAELIHEALRELKSVK